mmetsp:Transcript_140383/g.364957  ORF Transcript_140383/g.364957 Transcript_140383/m.364957 type:complete len:1253 (-) Transcript_140383:150-3908(-)
MTIDDTDRIIDEKQWRANVIDLKRCMSVAKSVYVQLEHGNEALLRVGVEIVTCRVAKKVLWWDDNWFANESKFNYFKDIVKEKLAIALGHVKGMPPSFLEEPSPKAGGSDDPEMASLRKRLEEAQALSRAAQLQQKALEAQCREAVERASTLEAAMEKAKDSFKQMVKEAEEAAAAKAIAEYEAGPGAAAIKAAVSSALAAADKESQKAIAAASKGAAAPGAAAPAATAAAPPAPAASGSSAEDKKRIAELERQLKQGQEERTKLEQKVKQAEKKAADAASEARAAQARSSKLAAPQDSVADTRLSSKASSKHPSPRPEAVAGGDPVKIDALEVSLKGEKKKNDELREAKKGLEAELEKLRKELKTAGEKAEAAEGRCAKMQDRIKTFERQAASNGGQQPPPQPTGGEQASSPVPVRQAAPTTPSGSGGSGGSGLCRRCGGSCEDAEDDREADSTAAAAAATRRNRQPKDAEMEELRRKAGLLDGLKAKLGQKDEEIAHLKEENAKLEDLRNRMGRMLSQVRDQLQKVTAIAEKRGYGNIIHEIMEEAEVTETINSAEYTCFTRLWEDALRRQAKQKSLQQRLGGDAGEESRGNHFLKKKVAPISIGGSGGGGMSQDETLADFLGVPDDPYRMLTPESSARGHRSARQVPHAGGQDRSASPDRDEEYAGDASYKAGYETGYRAGFEAAIGESGSRPPTGSRKHRSNPVGSASHLEGGHLSVAGHAFGRASAGGDFSFDGSSPWDPSHMAAGAGDAGSSPGLSSTAPPGSARGASMDPRRAREADDYLEASHRSGRRPSDALLRGPLPPVETIGGSATGGRRPSGSDLLRGRAGSISRTSDGLTGAQHHSLRPASLGSSVVDRSLRKPSKRDEGGLGLDRHGDRTVGGLDRDERRLVPDGAGFGADGSVARPSESSQGGADHRGRRPSDGGVGLRTRDGGIAGLTGGSGGLADSAAALHTRDGAGLGGQQRSGNRSTDGARAGMDRTPNLPLDGVINVASRGANGNADHPAHSPVGLPAGSLDHPSTSLRPVTGPFRERVRTPVDLARPPSGTAPPSPALMVGSSPGSMSSSTLPRTGSQQRPRTHGMLTHSASAPGELPYINGVEGLGLGHLYGGSAASAAPVAPPASRRGGGNGGGGAAPSPPPEEARPLGPRGSMIVSDISARRATSPRPSWSPSPRVMWRPNKRGATEIDVTLSGGVRAVAVIDPLPLAPSGYLPHGKVGSTFPGAGGRRADALLDGPVEAIGTRIGGD